MKKLVITVEPNREGFEKLCPNPNMYINGWEIIVNPEQKTEADFWIVHGNGRPNDKFKVLKTILYLWFLNLRRRRFIQKKYYQQFHQIVDTHKDSGHPRIELAAPCFPWHVGLDSKNDAYTLGLRTTQ